MNVGNSSQHGRVNATPGLAGRIWAENVEGRLNAMKPRMVSGSGCVVTERISILHALRWQLVVLVQVGLCCLGGLPTPGFAQETSQPSLHDVVIKIVNGTTREPGQAEKVVIYRRGTMARPLHEADDVSGEVNFGILPLVRHARYIVEVTAGGVPYYAEASGQDLENEPVTVYVFSPTTDLAGLRATGMNLVIHLGESALQLEYLFTVVNESRPQQTVVPQPASLQLALAPGTSLGRVESLRGPQSIAVSSVPGSEEDRIGLALALTPGNNRLRITGTVPYRGNLELPVGANIPITEWSVLTFPADIEVRGPGLEPVPTDLDADFQRHRGPALAAGETIVLSLTGGSGPQIDRVEISSSSPASSTLPDTGTKRDSGGGLSRYWWIIVLVGIVVFVILRRSKP